jgi:hypothetical protein
MGVVSRHIVDWVLNYQDLSFGHKYLIKGLEYLSLFLACSQAVMLVGGMALLVPQLPKVVTKKPKKGESPSDYYCDYQLIMFSTVYFSMNWFFLFVAGLCYLYIRISEFILRRRRQMDVEGGAAMFVQHGRKPGAFYADSDAKLDDQSNWEDSSDSKDEQKTATNDANQETDVKALGKTEREGLRARVKKRDEKEKMDKEVTGMEELEAPVEKLRDRLKENLDGDKEKNAIQDVAGDLIPNEEDENIEGTGINAEKRRGLGEASRR